MTSNDLVDKNTLPVRRLDFTNLPPGTPPQQSHRGLRLEFPPSTEVRKDDGKVFLYHNGRHSVEPMTTTAAHIGGISLKPSQATL